MSGTGGIGGGGRPPRVAMPLPAARQRGATSTPLRKLGMVVSGKIRLRYEPVGLCHTTRLEADGFLGRRREVDSTVLVFIPRVDAMKRQGITVVDDLLRVEGVEQCKHGGIKLIGFTYPFTPAFSQVERRSEKQEDGDELVVQLRKLRQELEARTGVEDLALPLIGPLECKGRCSNELVFLVPRKD